jgi:hypothetical protein
MFSSISMTILRRYCAMQAFGPELLDSSTVRKIIKVGTDVTAIATDAVTILQYALVRWPAEVFWWRFV